MTVGRVLTFDDIHRAAAAYSAPDDDARVTPCDLDAEKALLGAVLVDEQQLGAIDLPVGDLWRDAHQRIYQAMLMLRERGEPIDLITLRVALGPEIEAVGGPAYIAGLTDGVPRAANAPAYAKRIRQLATARRAIALCRRTTALLHDRPEAIVNGLPAEHARTWTEITAPPETQEDRLLDDVELVARPPAAELIKGRLRARSFVVVWGESGSGKTTVAIDLACAIATGRPWLGAEAMVNGVVIYILAEGADAFGPRLAAWKRHAEIPLEQVIGVYTHGGPVQLLDSVAVEHFITLARPLCPTAIVIDVYARCLRGDENSSQDAGAAVAAIDRLRDGLGATVVLLHHATKTGDRERGSSALRAAADTVVQLMAVDDLLTLKCEKQRDSAPFSDVSLRLVPDGAACRVELAGTLTPSGPLTAVQQRLLHALEATFTREGATAHEWMATCSGLHERAFYRARKMLLARGAVRKMGTRFVVSEQAGLTED